MNWHSMTACAGIAALLGSASLAIEPFAKPTASPAKFMSQSLIPPEAAASSLEDLVAAYSEAGILDGVVIVTDSQGVIHEEAAGLSNRPFAQSFDLSTRVRIASVSKLITAAMLLRLVEQGALALDQTVSDLLPGYEGAGASRITVSDLLSHASGIPNYQYTPEFEALQSDALLMGMGSREITASDIADVFAPAELAFEPGAQYQYSNSNYVLLQAIIERVTDGSFQEALAELVTTPLGLEDTGALSYRSVVPNLADGYVLHPQGFQTPFQAQFIGVPSVGGVYTSAHDMARFARALFGGTFFSDAETLSVMLEPRRTAYNDASHIGYGVFLTSIEVNGESVEMMGHDGWGPPFTANLQYVPSLDLVIFAADNTSGLGGRTHGEVFRLTEDIVRILHGETPNRPVTPIDVAYAEMVRAIGSEAALSQLRATAVETPERPGLEGELNSLGYALKAAGDLDQAISLFQLNTELFPASANTFDSLGEALLASADRSAALASYRRAAELDPNNARIGETIEMLEQQSPD